MDEQIIARRITLNEYLDHCAGKTEYLNGKIMVDRTELFVGVKEFAESIKVIEEERTRLDKDGGSDTMPELEHIEMKWIEERDKATDAKPA